MTIYIYNPKKVLYEAEKVQPKKQRHWFADYKAYYSKWDKTVRVIIFCILIGLLIGLVIDTITVERKEVTKTPHSRNLKENDDNCTEVLIDEEIFYKCTNFDEENIQSLVDKINNISVESYDIKLTLSGNFKNSRIHDGWLDGVEHNVTKLIISESNLEHIGAGSFANSPFHKLQYLMLQNTNIDILKRHSFEGALLTTFEIQFSDSVHELKLEDEVFEYVSDTLDVLAFSKCNIGDQLVNVIGDNGNTLNKLKILALEYNDIFRLSNKSLTRVPNILSLYLRFNNLRFIEPNTFSQLTKLELLHLDENSLEYIPEGLFDNFQGRNGSIHIDTNKWNCNCSLVWLRHFFTANRTQLFKATKFMCGNSDYTEVDFCPTGQPPPNFENITCKLSRPFNISSTNTITDSYHVKIRDQQTTLVFEQLNYKAKYEITIDPPLTSNEFLLFINANKTSDIQCIYPDQSDVKNTKKTSKMFIDGLEHGKTYTICLINATTFSPKDCTGLTVPKELVEDNIMLEIIIVFCASLLIATILSGLIMYFLIRMYPKLIAGGKIIVMEGLDEVRRVTNLSNTSYSPSFQEQSTETYDGIFRLSSTVYEEVRDFFS